MLWRKHTKTERGWRQGVRIKKKVCAVRYADEGEGIKAGVDTASPSGPHSPARTHT